jgi:predicted Zn-dependent peptidase
MQTIECHKLESGLHIVTEKMPGVRTTAVNWTVCAGVATNKHDGDSVLLSELVQRGVKHLSAKQHNDALESLGVKRQVTCGIEFFVVSGVMLGSRAVEAIPLFGEYLMNATLPEQDLAACKSLCMQSIHSLVDNPARQVGVAINANHHPSPFNRSAYGDPTSIESASIDRLHRIYKQLFVPDGSILVVAGDVVHKEIVEVVERITRGWRGKHSVVSSSKPPSRGVHWIEQDTSQSHIALAFDGPNAGDDGELQESIAMSIFGGATSGRLFTQVRQRRSLCYSVSARYASSRDRSVVRIHAGTTPQRADETVRICLEQLKELRNGVSRNEFDRAIRRMKSRTVMNGESTSTRASTLWSDYYALGKPKTLADRLREIDGVTFESVNDWLADRTLGQGTLVTLGPNEIEVDDEIFKPSTLKGC